MEPSSSTGWKDSLTDTHDSAVFHFLLFVTPFHSEKKKGILEHCLTLLSQIDETAAPCFPVPMLHDTIPKPDTVSLVPFTFACINVHPYSRVISHSVFCSLMIQRSVCDNSLKSDRRVKAQISF